MSVNRSHLLCISLAPGQANLAEVKRTGDRAKILRQSTLETASVGGLDQPAALGAALAEHLASNGYTTRHAVIGLCPRWVLARNKQVPPADPDAIRGIVNLQVEREFGGSASEMSFDYLLGETHSGAANASLLLVGVRKSVLQQVEQAALAAGLKIESITGTTLAAASGRTGTVVLVEPGVAGVMRVDNGRVAGMTSCPVDPTALGGSTGRSRLLADVSRCMLALPTGGDGDGLTFLLPPGRQRNRCPGAKASGRRTQRKS